MKTIELSGTLEFSNGGWSTFDKIKLVQEDGLKIDLVARLKEATESFGATGQVNYWVCDSPKTKEEAIEEFIGYLYGGIEAGYEKREVWYSTLTGGDTFYDTNLMIGGHDLYKELLGKEGKFLIIEINLIQKDDVDKEMNK